MGKVDFSNFVPDVVTYFIAFWGLSPWDGTPVSKRQQKMARRQIDREWTYSNNWRYVEEWQLTGEAADLYRAYTDGKLKRPANKPRGRTHKGDRIRWAMIYAREAKRQLQAQGDTGHVNLKAAREALDYLRRGPNREWDKVKVHTLAKNLRNKR